VAPVLPSGYSKDNRSTTDPTIPTNDFAQRHFRMVPVSDKYDKLIRQQGLIGWPQVFNGRLSEEWSRLQDEHLHYTKLTSDTRSGVLWTTNIITAVWQQFDIVWKLRNEVIHGNDTSTRNQVRQEKASNQVRRIYAHSAQYLLSDRDHLFEDVEEHLLRPTHSLQDWVSTYKPMFTASLKKAKQHSIDRMKVHS
jgi:hypothetical protein